MLTVIARSVNDQNDFSAFYAAAHEWRSGTPFPNVGPVDLNPPTFSILLSPLTFLSLHAARGVWIALSLAAFVDSLRRIRQRLALDARAMLWITCGCIGLQPAVFAWGLGQITWVLLWLVTCAWLASSHSAVRAGAWLGIAVAIKPPLALMAVLLPVATCLSAAGVSLAITLAAVAVTGWRPWQEWLASSARVNWLAWWPNASLWGIAARFHAGGLKPVLLRDLSVPAAVSIVLLGLALAVVVLRASNSLRWLLAGLWSVTVSPLGWTYYLPVFLAPALATRVTSRAALVTALVILAGPAGLFSPAASSSGWAAALAGSIYSGALLCLWIAWGRDQPVQAAGTVA